jgi:hypothetical protein
MTNPMEIWLAWIRGWTAATNSLIEAQRQALQRMTELPQQASAPAMREMERAARQAAPSAEAVVRMSAGESAPRGRGRKPAAAGEHAAMDEVLRAAGNKPTRRRGRPPKQETARKRGRPRKSR